MTFQAANACGCHTVLVLTSYVTSAFSILTYSCLCYCFAGICLISEIRLYDRQREGPRFIIVYCSAFRIELSLWRIPRAALISILEQDEVTTYSGLPCVPLLPPSYVSDYISHHSPPHSLCSSLITINDSSASGHLHMLFFWPGLFSWMSACSLFSSLPHIHQVSAPMSPYQSSHPCPPCVRQHKPSPALALDSLTLVYVSPQHLAS